jgi:hypothetical protein
MGWVLAEGRNRFREANKNAKEALDFDVGAYNALCKILSEPKIDLWFNRQTKTATKFQLLPGIPSGVSNFFPTVEFRSTTNAHSAQS